MIRRFLSFLLLVWALGFLWFAIALPGPRDGGRTDAVVVLTGGAGRIDRGLYVLRKGWSKQMLVSGVDREVRPREFAVQYAVPSALMACCVTLGFDAVDTRSNAREVAQWIARNRVRSIRLVTTDWHMRRAALEIGQQLPDGITVILDGVHSQPSLRVLFLEYHKLLARSIASIWEGG